MRGPEKGKMSNFFKFAALVSKFIGLNQKPYVFLNNHL